MNSLPGWSHLDGLGVVTISSVRSSVSPDGSSSIIVTGGIAVVGFSVEVFLVTTYI